MIKIRNSIFNYAKDSPKPVKMEWVMLIQTVSIKVVFISLNGSS